MGSHCLGQKWVVFTLRFPCSPLIARSRPRAAPLSPGFRFFFWTLDSNQEEGAVQRNIQVANVHHAFQIDMTLEQRGQSKTKLTSIICWNQSFLKILSPSTRNTKLLQRARLQRCIATINCWTRPAEVAGPWDRRSSIAEDLHR